MQKSAQSRSRGGFTLVEILVVLLLLSVLVAAVVPPLARQVESAEPVRAANDLQALRTGIEAFRLNVRVYPSDLEDMAFTPTGAADEDINGTADYSNIQEGRWRGPYVDATLTQTDGVTTGDAFLTGFDGTVQYNLGCYDPAVSVVDATSTPFVAGGTTGACATGEYVTVQIGRVGGTQMSAANFELLNDIIDGTGETDGNGATDSQNVGRLRFGCNGNAAEAATCKVVYYLATPYAS